MEAGRAGNEHIRQRTHGSIKPPCMGRVLARGCEIEWQSYRDAKVPKRGLACGRVHSLCCGDCDEKARRVTTAGPFPRRSSPSSAVPRAQFGTDRTLKSSANFLVQISSGGCGRCTPTPIRRMAATRGRSGRATAMKAATQAITATSQLADIHSAPAC